VELNSKVPVLFNRQQTSTALDRRRTDNRLLQHGRKFAFFGHKVISKEKDKCGGLLQSTLAGYTNLGYYRGETRAEIEKIINKTGSFR
jgi:hypothetical protein